MRRSWLLGLAASMIVTVAMAAPASTQRIVYTAAGRLALGKSDLCYSETGKTFTRRLSGAPCRVGDLAYLDVGFDSDEAADWAEVHCDFQRERPEEAMTVYGVLCYLRTQP